MPSTPTTKSQVQAYRFVLRRMQSALVRKDAVMLHDPMRTHSRATIVGVCLAVLGVLGFVIVGLLSPAPTVPDSGIIIAEPSGTVYVVSGNPKTLTPTFNLASARLLVLAQSQNPTGQPEGNAPAPTNEDNNATGQAPAAPTVVPDDNLKDIPKARLAGIPNGPQLLPTPDQRIKDDWGVCDRIVIDTSLPGQKAKTGIETTVLAGVDTFDRELREGESLLVKAQNNKTYLIYRTPTTVNQQNANAVRAEVDMNDASVVQALHLDPNTVRLISTGLLNAIPEVKKLTAPAISGSGATGALGLPVGSVFLVDRAGDKRDYYVVQSDGIDQIKATTADLIRYKKSTGGANIQPIRPDQIGALAPQHRIDDTASPDAVPAVLEAQASGASVACLQWSLQGTGPARDQHTSLHISSEVPTPKDAQGNKMAPVKISTPGADGQKVDQFFMPPGRAAFARGASSKQDFDTGSLSLISDRGVKFGIPNLKTASALGLEKPSPAPDAIIRLLPDGASMNTKDVMRSYDSVPVNPDAGTIATPSAQPGG
jgi:type VII secretion protein EccB